MEDYNNIIDDGKGDIDENKYTKLKKNHTAQTTKMTKSTRTIKTEIMKKPMTTKTITTKTIEENKDHEAKEHDEDEKNTMITRTTKMTKLQPYFY